MTINGTLNMSQSKTFPMSIWTFLMLVIGMSGNLTVIYGSIRHSALKLDQALLIFIHNLAVADIIYQVVYVFPALVTFTARQWVLGDVWCYIEAHGTHLPGIANSLLILAITLHRLLLFSFPTRTVAPWTAAFISGAVWTMAVVVQTCFLAYFGTDAEFYPLVGGCVANVVYNANASLTMVLAMSMAILLPLTFITIANAMICMIAYRRSTRARECMKGIMLTFLMSGVFIVSWIPFIARCIIAFINPPVGKRLEFFAYNSIAINTVANPIFYSLTNQRFRDYVSSGIREKIGILRRFSSSRPEEMQMDTL